MNINISYCDSWKRSYAGTKYCWLKFQQKMVNKLLLSDNAKYCYTCDSHLQKTVSKKCKTFGIVSPFYTVPFFFAHFCRSSRHPLSIILPFQNFTIMFYRISCGACWGRCGKGTCKLICHISNYLHWYKVVSYQQTTISMY